MVPEPGPRPGRRGWLPLPIAAGRSSQSARDPNLMTVFQTDPELGGRVVERPRMDFPKLSSLPVPDAGFRPLAGVRCGGCPLWSRGMGLIELIAASAVVALAWWWWRRSRERASARKAVKQRRAMGYSGPEIHPSVSRHRTRAHERPLAEASREPRRRRPTWAALLDRTDVLILDTETTGLGGRAEVIEVAMIDTTGTVRFEALSICAIRTRLPRPLPHRLSLPRLRPPCRRDGHSARSFAHRCDRAIAKRPAPERRSSLHGSRTCVKDRAQVCSARREANDPGVLLIIPCLTTG